MPRRHDCPEPEHECGICEAAMSQVETARAFNYGYSERDLDTIADAEAARDWANRGGE